VGLIHTTSRFSVRTIPQTQEAIGQGCRT
jgi:hypothetical protein